MAMSQKEKAQRRILFVRLRQLTKEIQVGMPTAESMRKAPPGAVKDHLAWERTNKARIAEWKNLQLRLRKGPEVASLERIRPQK